MVKSKLFEQPRIYIVFVLGLLLFAILNKLAPNETIASGLEFTGYVFLASFVLWVISVTTMKGKLKINSVANNTPKALGWAIIMILGLLMFSTIVGFLLGYASNIMTANSIAMIGAVPQFILENHAFLSILIIVFFIATLETMAIIQLEDIILSRAKSTYKLNDPKVWVVAIVLGLGATVFHSYSKFIPLTGTLNLHALIVVFGLFTSTCLLAVKMKEMESAIYYHVGNNFLAMAYRLRELLQIFGI